MQYSTYITSLSLSNWILDIVTATVKENYIKFGHNRFGLKMREILAFPYVFLKNYNTLGHIFRSNLPEVFSCQFSEIFKNKFFMEHLRWLLLHYSEGLEGLATTLWVFSSFYRICRLEVFRKKVVLGNFAKFTEKHLCQSFYYRVFIKKIDSDTGVFLAASVYLFSLLLLFCCLNLI